MVIINEKQNRSCNGSSEDRDEKMEIEDERLERHW